jgi:hypothetical protein
LLRLRQNAGIGFLDHHFAEIHADQVVLIEVVIEHVLGGFAQIDDPLAHVGRPYSKRHVLRVIRTGRMIVSAYAADAAGDEVRVAGIFALHEYAVAAKDGRGAVAFRHLPVGEIDFCVDPETPHDPRNRIPVHFDQVPALVREICSVFS